MLTQTFDIAARTPRVAVTVWFNLQDNPSWTGGLLHADLTRKPAWTPSPRSPAPPRCHRSGCHERPPSARPGLLRPHGAPPLRGRGQELAPPEPHVARAGDHRRPRAAHRSRRGPAAAAGRRCGTGFLLEQLAGRGFSGVGVDLSPESVAIAQKRLEELGAADRLRAEVGSAYEPPEGRFELITLTDVLEHLEDPRACLRALRERLAPGGLLVISTPNRRSLPGARRWLAERVPQLRIKVNLAPVDNWQTWGDLEAHGASAGLAVVSRRGIFFRPGGRVGSSSAACTRSPRPARPRPPCPPRRWAVSGSTSAWASGPSERDGDHGHTRPEGRGRRDARPVHLRPRRVPAAVRLPDPAADRHAVPGDPPVQPQRGRAPGARPHLGADARARHHQPGGGRRRRHPVRVLETDRAVPRGWFRAAWGGADDAGIPAPDGVYSLRLRAKAGAKVFRTSRRIVIDREGPAIAVAEAASAGSPTSHRPPSAWSRPSRTGTRA